MPKLEFTDTKGNTYDASFFNTTDVMPEGVTFSQLDFANSEVERLPDGLKADRLILGYSKLKQLPHQLRANCLYLRDSAIEVLPDDLEVDYLFTVGSKLRELRSGPTVTSQIHITSDVTIVNSFRCPQCLVYQAETGTVIDVTNLWADRLDVYPLETCLIKGVNAEKFVCHMGSTVNLTIDDSVFKLGKIRAQDKPLTYLSLLSGVKGEKLVVNASAQSEDSRLLLTLDRVHIDQVEVLLNGSFNQEKGTGGVVLATTLFGNLVIQGPASSLGLPEQGVVYGDLTLPHTSMPPAGFCCFGDIRFA